jgi:DNA-directed RNA polymerase subunit H
MTGKKFDPTKHMLVPKHSKLSETDKKSLLAKHNITLQELPKISLKDAAIAELDVKAGDIIKIVRRSPTSGESTFYRCVIDV